MTPTPDEPEPAELTERARELAQRSAAASPTTVAQQPTGTLADLSERARELAQRVQPAPPPAEPRGTDEPAAGPDPEPGLQLGAGGEPDQPDPSREQDPGREPGAEPPDPGPELDL